MDMKIFWFNIFMSSFVASIYGATSVEMHDDSRVLQSIQQGDIKSFKTLWQKVGMKEFLREYRIMDQTILHYSILQNINDIPLFLIQQGFLLEEVDMFGLTPLHVAVSQNNYNVFLALINKGADPYAKNIDEKTPYDLAVENESVEIVEYYKNVLSLKSSL